LTAPGRAHLQDSLGIPPGDRAGELELRPARPTPPRVESLQRLPGARPARSVRAPETAAGAATETASVPGPAGGGDGVGGGVGGGWVVSALKHSTRKTSPLR